MPGASAPRLAARVSFVLGKGGVGRTTVASALAVDFAVRGERTLLIGPKGPRELAERIRDEAARADVGDRLDVLQVAERDLVDDAVLRVTKIGPMAQVAFRHPAYESFIEIVPGVRELALLNLVYERHVEGRYARIVIDGPATGHGLHFLEAPDKASRLLVGKLKERADRLGALLRDPAKTEIVLVTLPQEIPVRETMDLARRLRDGGFPIDNLVVNRWMPSLFADREASELLDRLAADAPARERLAKAIAARSRIDVAQAVDALRLVRDERREAEARLAEIRRTDAKISVVPLLPDSADRLRKVAGALRRTLSAEEAAP